MKSWKSIQHLVHVQLLLFSLPFLLPTFSLETDTITSSSVIKDPDTIVSRGHVFKLGFFTPENTTNRYLGVFHVFSETTPVWVANRNRPLLDSSSTVTISKHGNLVLIDSRNQTVWSTHLPKNTSRVNTTLQIMDSGNLVLHDTATGATLWQTFSHPSDCFLPTMRYFDDTKRGRRMYSSSWKNASDPHVGSYKGGFVALDIPQIFTWKDGRPFWRSGQWNGLFFIGVQNMYGSYFDPFTVEDDHAGTFYLTAPKGNYMMKICVNSSGTMVQSIWDDQKKSWATAFASPGNECDLYGRCGPFGSCNLLDSPLCSCLRGFEPVKKDEWERGNWSSGCQRKNQLQCNGGDGFVKMQFMKVPDLAQPFRGLNEDECRKRCSRNCSCIAYAHEATIGCMLWRDTLIDMQKFTRRVGVDLHIRLPLSELDNHRDRKLYIIIPAVVGFAFVTIIVFIAWCWIVKRRGAKIKDKGILKAGQTLSTDSTAIVLKDESENVNFEQLPSVTFETIAKATDNFHDNNLLGRGGFGSVYKGNLADGKEIAVKRLSEASRQGIQEFKNEVILISKLQHRNLVRLLGCCVENEEKMLIYEYMPNKSLDICLFDPTHSSKEVLDWTKRINIIEGIGRGLLYLHKDSRLRIIHRDLKPSNVLLDQDWNPKISDFGMARMFGGNQDHANTARVVGTYGYMAPEYATEGRFSEKSDVYSFGVMMLEIVKGKKNTHYYNRELSLSLLGSGGNCVVEIKRFFAKNGMGINLVDGRKRKVGISLVDGGSIIGSWIKCQAWKHWSEDNGLGFADESIASSSLEAQIVRCIQIALLCVEEFPQDRPAIQTILAMLSHEIVDLPRPKQPVFAEKWNDLTTGSARPANQVGYSVNGLTLTELDGR